MSPPRSLPSTTDASPTTTFPAVLTALTLLAAVVTAVVVARHDRSFTPVLARTQQAVSVLVPFSGVLAVTGLRRPGADVDRRLGPRLVRAASVAAVWGLVAASVAAGTTAATGGSWPSGTTIVALVTAGVVVQVVAQSTGTGWGLLLRSPRLACAATIVVPLSVTALLSGAGGGEGPAVRWLTPYGDATTLLSGSAGLAALGPLVTVTLLWGVLPNVVGAVRTGHRPRASSG
jgi:hypothetical protein